jgi:hypothetical protein
MSVSIATKLEQYTIKHPDEVLVVELEKDDSKEKDQVIIYKGFSSSLMGSTNFDPDVSIMPSTAKIIKIDRLKSPYNPHNPHYIQQGLTLTDMEKLINDPLC